MARWPSSHARRRISAALTAFALCLSGRVRADEGRAASQRYETVVTGRAGAPSLVVDDPASFTTVIVPDPQAVGTELSDLLLPTPGVKLRDGGPGGGRFLSVRGAEAHQTTVVLDGIRLSGPGEGSVDLSLIEPSLLERIEVRRGGSSARFGSGAIGGVLSLSTARPRMRPLTRAALGYGSFDTFAARLMHTQGTLHRRLLVSGSYRQSRGDFGYIDANGVSAVRLNNDSYQGELLTKSDLFAAARWKVSLTSDLAVAERGAPGLVTAPCNTARQRDLRTLLSLSATRYDALLPGGTLELGAHHRLARLDFRDPCALNDPSKTVTQTVGAQARLTLPLGPWSRFSGGLEARGHLLADALGNVAVQDPSRAEGELFTQNELRLFRRHLALIPAVRLSLASGFSPAVVPELGLVLRPLAAAQSPFWRSLAAVASVGRSYRLPSFQELYVNLDSLRGNRNLAPEDALDGNLGLKLHHARFAFEAAYYLRRVKNLILFVPVSPFLVEAHNHSGASVDGVEAACSATLFAGLSTEASYTLTRTRFGDPARELPGHPRHRVSGGVGYQYPTRPTARDLTLRLRVGLDYQSQMQLDRFGLSPVFKEEGRVMLSSLCAVGYRRFHLSATAANLLDKRDAVDSWGFPLPGARVFVGLSYEH